MHGGHDCAYLLVHGDVNLDAGLGASLEHLVQPVLLVVERRPLQEQLWTEPPVGNVNGLLCLLQGFGHSPEVVSAVDVPFHQVAVSLGCKALESVALGNPTPLGVRLLLMLLVMAVVGIEEIGELSDLVLEMHSLNMRPPQLGMFEFLLDFLNLLGDAMVKRMEDLLKTLFLDHDAGRAQRSAINSCVEYVQ
jgi:hypothetical protein